MRGHKLVQIIVAMLIVAGSPVAASVVTAGPAQAHRDGCHRWHSCPSDSNSYICGDLGDYSECPAGGSDTSTPEPSYSYDFEPPRRPTFARPNTGAGGLVQIPVRAEQGSRLVIRDAGRVVATLTATGALQTVYLHASTGRHHYRAVATDAAGNSSYASAVTVDADATPPPAHGVNLTPGSPADARSELAVESDPRTRYLLQVDGRTMGRGTTADGAIDKFLDLANGRHRVALQLRDAVGNVRLLSRNLDVQVAHLAVDATDTSVARDGTQVFHIEGTPGARGSLRIPGLKTQVFRLDDGSQDVALDLADGTYGAPIVTLLDTHDRRGVSRLAPFVVDTTAPRLLGSSLRHQAELGLFAAVITADRGSHVTWRILDAAHHTVDHGHYLATGAARRLQRDVPEGSYQLELTATDEHGNPATQTISSAVAADPLTATDIVVTSLVIAVLLAALAGLFVAWRRNRDRIAAWRERRRREAAQRQRERQHTAAMAAYHREVAQYQAALAAHQREDTRWKQRREELSGLLELARHATPREINGFANVKLKRGEKVFCTVPGAMIEMRSRQGSQFPEVVDHGQLTITTMRVAFNGTKNRDWAFDKLERLLHVGSDRTMMKVANRKTVSGFSYSDAEKTRLYFDLVRADHFGSRESVIDSVGGQLHQHEASRPTPPTPPGPPPAPPSEPTGQKHDVSNALVS